MTRTRFSATDLPRLQSQLTTWRRAGRRRRPLPAEAWEAAAHLARTHGLSPVARCLRLDYDKLRQRSWASALPAAQRPAPPCPEGFVEIPWAGSAAAPGAAAARIELRDAQGRTMTLHVPGEAAVLVALAESFWRRS